MQSCDMNINIYLYSILRRFFISILMITQMKIRISNYLLGFLTETFNILIKDVFLIHEQNFFIVKEI